jgi:hypothetical protein
MGHGMTQVNRLSQLSSKKIWIARPSAAYAKKGASLPVDWGGITRRGAMETNYQVLPDDRVFIAQDELVALNNSINKTVALVKRMLHPCNLSCTRRELGLALRNLEAFTPLLFGVRRRANNPDNPRDSRRSQ